MNNIPAFTPSKRPITITVSGERGSGKTTLIAILAQALSNAGHAVATERHVPNGTTAMLDLREQFVLTFNEVDADADTPTVEDVISVVPRLPHLTRDHLIDKLAEFRDANIKLNQELHRAQGQLDDAHAILRGVRQAVRDFTD